MGNAAETPGGASPSGGASESGGGSGSGGASGLVDLSSGSGGVSGLGGGTAPLLWDSSAGTAVGQQWDSGAALEGGGMGLDGDADSARLFPGLAAALAAAAADFGGCAPPPPPLGHRVERESYMIGPWQGVVRWGAVIPLGNTTVKATTTRLGAARVAGLGLPLSAYVTVGWGAKLLGGLAVVVLCVVVAATHAPFRVTDVVTLPCYFVLMVASLTLASFVRR